MEHNRLKPSITLKSDSQTTNFHLRGSEMGHKGAQSSTWYTLLNKIVEISKQLGKGFRINLSAYIFVWLYLLILPSCHKLSIRPIVRAINSNLSWSLIYRHYCAAWFLHTCRTLLHNGYVCHVRTSSCEVIHGTT